MKFAMELACLVSIITHMLCEEADVTGRAVLASRLLLH